MMVHFFILIAIMHVLVEKTEVLNISSTLYE